MARKKTPKGEGNSTTGGPGPRQVDQTIGWRLEVRASRLKLDDAAKKTFLEHFAENGRMMSACKAAGIFSESTVRNHLKNDTEFAEAFQAAKDAYRDKFKTHLQNLAYDGIRNPVFQKTKEGGLEQVGEKVEYPIRLVEMEAKRVDPEYRDKQEIDLNHKGGVILVPATLSPEEWIKLYAATKPDSGDEPAGS